MTATHKHRCKKCRTVWQHGNRRTITRAELATGVAETDREHRCPACGKTERNVYTGKRKAQFRHTHTLTVRMDAA
jgi:Zn finger protein HypA/HybF involved in hydrogenase expression